MHLHLPHLARGRAAVTVTLVAVGALVAGTTTQVAAGPVTHSQVVSANPVDWTPHVLDGQVNAIVKVGTKVIVGGTFTQVRTAADPTVLARSYLFAFDTGTGAIDETFVPLLNGNVQALTLAGDGQSVYVAGAFSSVNAKAIRKVARLDTTTGQPVAGFSANANNEAQDLALRDGWLYVSGKFTTIRAVPRAGLARLNPTTGAVDAGLNLPFTDPPGPRCGFLTSTSHPTGPD